MHLDLDAEMATENAAMVSAIPEAAKTTALEGKGEEGSGEKDIAPGATSPSFLMATADPFLALQNDLDDVSEVIKHNLVADEQLMSAGNSPSPVDNAQSAKLEMEMSPHCRDGSLPREFMDEDPSKQRQIGQILHLLQQPENNNNQNQSAANFDHFELSPMAAATNSPNSLMAYTFGAQHLQGGNGQSDPMIGGGGPSISPAEGRMHHFLQRPEFGQGEMGNPMQGQIVDQSQSQHFHQYSQMEQNWAKMPPHFRPQMPTEDESPPPVEPNFGGGIKQEMLLTMEHPQRAYGPENEAVAAKNELIRMLLEMSPQELEHLRASRAHRLVPPPLNHPQTTFPTAPAHHLSQPIFIQTGPPPPHFLHQQSPPLDPPPPGPQFQMDLSHQFVQPLNGQFIAEYPPGHIAMPLQSSTAHFYPSPTGSTALTSPISNEGGFPSLAPSEFLEEESAMEEIWTDGEMLGGGNFGENEEDEGEEGGMGERMANGGPQRGQGRRKTHKTERRTAHNLIEKKYRCSINDRINQLKEMLATEEQQKLSKSATLRRAVDHILSLRSKNSELANENVRLRQTLEMAGIAPPAPRLPSPAQQRAAMRAGKQQMEHQSNANKNPRARLMSTKRGPPMPGPRDQSRVTLCVFMFLLLAFNPLALFFAHSGDSLSQNNPQGHFGHHRTLVAADDQFFGGQFAQSQPAPLVQQPSNRPPPADQHQSADANFWSSSPPWFRQILIWLLNSLFVFAILNRLLVSGEPVADRRSPRWGAFLETRRKAGQAVAAGNWKEAQRELDESLQLLERQLPSSGGVDEWMSLTWQIIRHLLNVLWIGRWFARRRRPSVQSQKSVCRSHAAAAMVYHQLHQLHLLGVDGIGLTQGGALNLALLAANLAESAGSSAISHALRAEIYACAGIRCRLCMPKWMRRIISGYFFRRAKRHVSKSQRLEGTQMNSLQWVFHPLARRFLADPQRIVAILRETGAQKTPNFPFSDSAQSPKPVEVLRDSFKMHLLNGLLAMVDSAEGNFRVADFVEQSQLLMQICKADVGWNGAGWNCSSGSEEGDKEEENGNGNAEEEGEQALFDLLSPSGSLGDEFCNWWANLLSGALHWRHGDLVRARQHCAVVRKCPKELGQNDLALAVGLAFCSRKICLEDRRKGAWAEMVLLHTQRAFAHLRRADRHCQWREGEQNWQSTTDIQRHFRLICCQWLLSSLLDLCSFSIGPGQDVPLEVRRLYSGILIRMEGEGIDGVKSKKLAMFRHLGETLCGIVFVGNGDSASRDRLQMDSPSPAPSSVGSSSPSNLGLPIGQQQRRKNTIEVLGGTAIGQE